jgi:hypothetical protein
MNGTFIVQPRGMWDLFIYYMVCFNDLSLRIKVLTRELCKSRLFFISPTLTVKRKKKREFLVQCINSAINIFMLLL